MATLFGPDTFAGSNGDPVTGWSAGTYNTSGTNFTYQSGWGRIDCGSATGYTGKSGWRITGLSDDDVRITGRFKFEGSDDGALRIIVRGDTALDSQWGYVLVFDRSGTDDVYLGKDVDYSGGLLDGPDTYDLTSGDVHHFDMDVAGTSPGTIKVWVWADGDTKPTTPTFQVNDSDVTSPGVVAVLGIGGNAGGQLIDVDDVKVTDGTGDLLLTGSVTPVGALVKTPTKTFAGSVTPVGALQQLKVILQLLTGSVTPTGVTLIARTRLLTGSVTPVGTFTKVANKVLTGSATAAGNLIKGSVREFSGSVTPVGNLVATFVGRVVGSPGIAEMTVRAASWVRMQIRRR